MLKPQVDLPICQKFFISSQYIWTKWFEIKYNKVTMPAVVSDTFLFVLYLRYYLFLIFFKTNMLFD